MQVRPIQALAATALASAVSMLHASAIAADTPLDLVCQTENLERSCAAVPSVDGYRFLRTCVTSALASGGYVAFTDDLWRANRVPEFCEGATPEQIRDAITARGGAHAERLLHMVRELTFDGTGRFAALSGVTWPGGAAPSRVAIIPDSSPAPSSNAIRQQPARVRSTGTGFLIGAGNVAITNFHVVEACKRIAVVAGDTLVDAKLLATDDNSDLAAIRIAGPAMTSVALSDGEEELGAEITVLGYRRQQDS